MKRFLKILGLIILIIIAAAIILPFVFKDEIIAKAKTEINKNINAEVDFADISISLFRQFPDVSVGIDELSVKGIDNFEGTQLAYIEDINVGLNLFSVISGSNYEVEEIAVKNAKIHIVVDTAGNANYNVAMESENVDTVATEESSPFKFTLKKYSLENVDIIYDDKGGEIYANIRNLDHNGSGDFTEEIVAMETKTEIEKLTVKSGGIAYLNNVKSELDADFEFNQTEFKLTFKENRLSLNDLPIHFDGWVALPDENITMDLKMDAPENNFKNVLSLIPAVYTDDFSGMEASGNFALNATASGTYNGEQEIYPQFDIKMDVENGSFRYPDLPAGVDDIQVDAHIYNKTDKLDGTVVNVPKMNANVGGAPVSARLNLQNPISNPKFDAYLKTDLNLASLGSVVPSEDYDYQGSVRADIDVAGTMSDIENENYANVKADGMLVAQNIVLKSDSLPYDISLQNADFQFSPQFVSMKIDGGKIGRSDFAAEGRIDNLLTYYFGEKPLAASFTLNSNLLDLNELMPQEEADETEETETETETTEPSEISTVRLPEDIAATISADLQKVLYDNLEIENVDGDIVVENGRATLQNLSMNLLDGGIVMNGYYDSKPEVPAVDFKLDIDNFSLKESFDKLVTVQKLAPIMNSSTGSYSTSLSFNAKLLPTMSPDMSTVDASGKLTTKNLSTSPKVMEKVSNLLKKDDLKTLSLGRVNLSFSVEDGLLKVEPFDLKAGNVSATVSGTTSLEQELDYTMALDIPAGNIGSNQILEQIGAASGGKLQVPVSIGGTVQNPKVSLGDFAGNLVENLKDKAKEKLDEAKEDAKEKINEKTENLIAEAEKQGDKLIAAAEKQKENLVKSAKDAAAKIKKEADRKADDLEKEAEGNLLKEKGAKIAADKLRKEGREKGDKLINEAEKKGDDLIREARDEKADLVRKAREKSEL